MSIINITQSFKKQSAPPPCWEVYETTVIDGENDPAQFDTMQIYQPYLIIIGNYIHAYYIANSTNILWNGAEDVDITFLSRKNLNDGLPITQGWTKVTSPKKIIDNIEGSDTAMTAYICKINTLADNSYRITYVRKGTSGVSFSDASSTDGIVFTKSGNYFLTNYFVQFTPLRRSDGNWIAIANDNAGESKKWTSTDGRNWTDGGAISLSYITYVSEIIEYSGVFYIYGFGALSGYAVAQDTHVRCYSTLDFINFTDRGIQFTALLETERMGAVGVVFNPLSKKWVMLWSIYKFRQRIEGQGDNNGFMSIRVAELDNDVPYASHYKRIYPAYLKKYYALYNVSGSVFKELINDENIFAFTPSFTADDKFLNPSGSQRLQFASYTAPPTDFAVKIRVGGGSAGVQPVVCQEGAWYVLIRNNKLEVGLSDDGSTYKKIYRSIEDCTISTGLNAPFRDVYNRVDVGFIWQAGVLKLYIENAECTLNMIANSAMININASSNPVKVLEFSGAYSTNPMRNVSLMSGCTVTEYINNDMM